MIMSRLRFLFGRLDWSFLLAIGLLITTGILFIYSASFRNDEHVLSAMARRQIVWALVGGTCFVVAALTDYRKLGESSWLIFIGCIILLVLVLLIGKKVYGAYRWLNLFGIQIQPSEFAKLGTVIMMASYMGQPSRDVTSPKTLLTALGLLAIPFVLIMEQPDLGTAMTLVPATLVILFAAGTPMKYLGVLALIGVLALPVGWFTLDPYQKERIHVFFDPGRDPLGTGWNKIQSEIAVGSGGMTGKGYLQGTQNVLGYLPRTVAPTDFIFSVIAEEMGFVGSALLLSLYAVLLIGGMRAAWGARDKLGRLLAAGFVTLLFFHVFVNMGMTIGLMPVTGIPLPLISYGGSFMICTMSGLGIVQSVYARRFRR